MLGGFPGDNNRPQAVSRKIEAITADAVAAGIPAVAEPLADVYDHALRNAVFHADYSLHGGEVRLPREGTRYRNEEVMERVNKALAYFDALTILFDHNVGSYTEPVQIPVNPTFARGAPEEATVIVRRRHGVVGLKHSLTPQELAAGGIPWRLGIFTPDELALLEEDAGLALLPERRRRESLLSRFLRRRPSHVIK